MTNEQRRETLLLITEKLNACIVKILSQDDESYEKQTQLLTMLTGMMHQPPTMITYCPVDLRQQLHGYVLRQTWSMIDRTGFKLLMSLRLKSWRLRV